ncbi:MAG: hypothetical protein DIU68_002615 [Chloroflexota bacterium]|nr:MAG: hypothetical protein DIU68_20730 [Chloroflexota bacterium]
MGDFRGYLQRLNVRPDPEALGPAGKAALQAHFDPYAAEVVVNGRTIAWSSIDEVEVVRAARVGGPAGWLVKQMYGEDRYHVGIYFGPEEAVLTNVPLSVAEHVVRTIAFYAPHPVRYSGVEGLSPIAHG